jgi:hypothetical protein
VCIFLLWTHAANNLTYPTLTTRLQDFMVLGELIGEESSGALAAEIIAARHINQNPDPALFGACIPNVTLHLRDHQGKVDPPSLDLLTTDR